MLRIADTCVHVCSTSDDSNVEILEVHDNTNMKSWTSADESRNKPTLTIPGISTNLSIKYYDKAPIDMCVGHMSLRYWNGLRFVLIPKMVKWQLKVLSSNKRFASNTMFGIYIAILYETRQTCQHFQTQSVQTEEDSNCTSENIDERCCWF